MARYYLHIWKGEVLECEDKEGAEVASLEDAYLEAFASAQELWNDLIRKRRDPFRHHWRGRSGFDRATVWRNPGFLSPCSPAACGGGRNTRSGDQKNVS